MSYTQSHITPEPPSRPQRRKRVLAGILRRSRLVEVKVHRRRPADICVAASSILRYILPRVKLPERYGRAHGRVRARHAENCYGLERCRHAREQTGILREVPSCSTLLERSIYCFIRDIS